MYHIPVMLEQSIEGLHIQPDGTYVDATFGGGGHAKAILGKLTTGRLFGFDQDPDTTKNILQDERFTFINQNFRYLKNFLQYHHAVPVNGLLADLGVSSHQLDTPSRGFSTRFEGELDMRMGTSQSLTAAEIVNGYPEEELRSIFRKYGELKNSHHLAGAIVAARNRKSLKTTSDVVDAVGHCFPANKQHKFLALVFQALRIAVNNELEALESLLEQSAEVIDKGGRLVVISYHSLEDRLVKNFIKTGNTAGLLEKDFYGNPIVSFKAINNKPIEPDEKEVLRNNRARSAKLRIGEKI